MQVENTTPETEQSTATQTPAKTKKQLRDEKKEAKKKEPKSLKVEIMSWILTILAAVVIASLIRAFIFEPIRVDGNSMTNTLQNGEVVFTSKIDYLIGSPSRNDIVICRYPNRLGNEFTLGAALSLQAHTLFVKRLVALPGDTVEIKDAVLYVNDEKVENPEHMASEPRDFEKITLGEDEYFVMGDNRYTSHDSRSDDVGPISRNMIMGHVRCVLWPLSAIRGVN